MTRPTGVPTGRPPKPPGAKQAIRVMVNLTPAEAAALDSVRGTVPRSAWLRGIMVEVVRCLKKP